MKGNYLNFLRTYIESEYSSLCSPVTLAETLSAARGTFTYEASALEHGLDIMFWT